MNNNGSKFQNIRRKLKLRQQNIENTYEDQGDPAPDPDVEIVTIDTNSEQRLKQVLEELSETDNSLKEYLLQCRTLRQRRTELREESIQLMSRHNIEEINVSSMGDRYRVRHQRRKLNPLTKQKLPGNLTQYFIQCQRESIEAAKRKASEIIGWIMDHTEESVNVTLYKKSNLKSQ